MGHCGGEANLYTNFANLILIGEAHAVSSIQIIVREMIALALTLNCLRIFLRNLKLSEGLSGIKTCKDKE